MKEKSAIRNVFHLILALLLTQLFAGATKIHQPDKRPNILFIMNDDMSWVDFGAYGCKVVKTPVFDELAQKGILFKNAFSAAPNCSASRASILTGRYPCELEEAGTRDGIDFKHNDGMGDWNDIIVRNIFVDECWGKPFNMHIREGGRIKDVIIENYSCKSTGNKSFIKGLNRDSQISNIIINNMVLNGGKVSSPGSGNFEINQFTANISFQ